MDMETSGSVRENFFSYLSEKYFMRENIFRTYDDNDDLQ